MFMHMMLDFAKTHIDRKCVKCMLKLLSIGWMNECADKQIQADKQAQAV